MKILITLITIIMRLVVFPFFFGTLLIATIKSLILASINFLIYGGTSIVYTKYRNQKNIIDLYNKMDDFLKTK